MAQHTDPDRYRVEDQIRDDTAEDGWRTIRVIGTYGIETSARWRAGVRQSRYPLLYGGDHPTHRMEIVDTHNRGTK